MSTIVDFPVAGANIGISRKPKRFDIELYQGDTFPFYLRFTGTSLDVTGWTAASTVKKISDETVMSGIITISAVDTVNKRFLIDIDSDTLESGVEYMYDVQVTDASGNKRTFIGGKITTTEDITDP
jgi:hypothetical protein